MMKIYMPPVTASNPYLDFAHFNNLNYGDVLNYVGILDNEDKTYWHELAISNLNMYVKNAIELFTINLRRHYGICSQPTLKPS